VSLRNGVTTGFRNRAAQQLLDRPPTFDDPLALKAHRTSEAPRRGRSKSTTTRVLGSRDRTHLRRQEPVCCECYLCLWWTVTYVTGMDPW